MTFSSNPDQANDFAAAARARLDAEGSDSPVAKAIDPKQVVVRKRSLVIFAIACFVGAALIASSASGQGAEKKYDSIKMDPRIDAAAAVRTMKAETRSFASTGRGKLNVVRTYFERYVPGKMTAPDGVDHLSDIVSDVTGYLERANKGGRPEIAKGLSGLTFQSLSGVATGNYHPAARIAATVIVGGLDSKAVDVANRKPPVPMATALPILVSLYEDENNVDGLRAAALQGIHRHTMYSFESMPADVKTKLTTMMNELLDSDAPVGRDVTAHAFLQRYAVDILDYTSTGEDASLGMKLVSISTEPKSLEMIALHSASRLATMSKVLENKIDDPKKVLWSWTARTLTAFENEIERIEGMKRRTANVRQPQDPSTHLRKPEKVKEGRRVGTGMRGDMDGGYGGDMMDGMDGGYGEDMMGGYDDMMGSGYDEMMDGDMGGYGRRLPEVIQAPEIVATRRKLNHVLQLVHLGVTGSPTSGMPEGDAGGLLGTVDEEMKKEIETWTEEMEDVLDEINYSQIELTQEFLTVLKEQIKPLEELLDSIDDSAVAAEAPRRNGGIADGLEDELLEGNVLEEDLMAEPVLLP